MVRVDAAQDGTFTLLLDGRPVVTGLTETQAGRLAASYEARHAAAVAAPLEREAALPLRGLARLRDALRRRLSSS